MDIKDLNKSQLILLAVLLSFVTSIATGITTVTLMQQAPASFTAPINRVIQQTVEKIQQVEGKTVVQTVIVKEEDLVVDAIEKNKTSVFALSREATNTEGVEVEVSVGRAFAVSSEGIVAADALLVPEKGRYYLKNDSGKFRADFMSVSPTGFVLLKIGAPLNDTDKPVFSVPAFGDLNKMKVGQKVLILGANISSFIFEGLNTNNVMDLSVTPPNTGGLVLNLDGEALGIALSGGTAPFASIKNISDALPAPAGATVSQTE